MNRSRNHGVALFAAIFLIVVLAAIGIAVAMLTSTQQLASAQGLEAARAYYVARARMERGISEAIATGACPAAGDITLYAFTTRLSCVEQPVNEGGTDYTIIALTVSANRGSRAAGTRVRRELRVQLTAGM